LLLYDLSISNLSYRSVCGVCLKKVAKYKLHFPLVLQSTRAIEHFEIPEVPFTYKMICKELPLRIMCSQMAKLLPYMKYHFANSLV